MHIARPLAALSAITLAVAALGSATASGASASASSDRHDRAVAGAPASPGDRSDLERRLTGDRTGPRQAKVRLVATTKGPVTARAVRASARALGFTIGVGELDRLGMVSVETTPERAEAVQAALGSLAGVESVRTSTQYQPMWTPTDPKYGTQQKGMFGALQAPAAWDVQRGDGATIAVLDSGFDVTHPDLAGKIASTWDVVAGNTNVTESSASLAHGHGTAVASVAAAATNNGKGIAGGAPDAKLLLVGIGDSLGDIYDDASSAGIIWAADHGADVIVMSYGGPMASAAGSPGDQAAYYATKKGAILVAAAGNTPTFTENYPAGFSYVIAVGATNLLGTAQTPWSTYGGWIEVAAPGVDVPVALPLADDTFDGVKDGYSRLSGTSFSAPLVGAQAALLKMQRPKATWRAVRNAITGTTKPITPQAHGTFAGGLVQWKASLDAVSADTAITSAVIPQPGTVQVAVTSSAPQVMVTLDGDRAFAHPAALQNGATVLTVNTWGRSGQVDVAAYGCDESICAEAADHTQITVANPAPIIDPALDGAVLTEDTFVVALAAGAPSGPRFVLLADGATEPFAWGGDGQSVEVDTGSLLPGAHTIRAVYCRTDSVCDTTHPSDPVSVTVQRLHPTVSLRGNGLASPNGDGRKDGVTVDYTLDQASDASIGVKAGGSWVYGPIDISSDGPTSGSWTWDGSLNPGMAVSSGGSVIVELVTSKPGDATLRGRAYGILMIDLKKPVLGLGTAAPRTVYPIVDGYADSTDLGAKTNEQLAAWWITVYNSKGTRVRTLTGGPGTYRASARWNGRSTSGALVAPGAYTFTVLVEDLAGNRSLTPAVPITVSGKKLVLRTASRKLSADGAARLFYYDRTCTVIYSNARPGVWPSSSLEYVSRKSTSACPKGPKYYAITENRFTLPTAIKYSTFKISTYGGGSIDGTGHRDDVAELDYLLRDGDSIGRTITLSAPTTTHTGPTVRAAEYLVNGREARWLSGTSNGNWYDIRDFTITWSYYVLA
jgi:subtilisin family serine protease